MPRKQNLNKIFLRWDENDMNQAVSSVMEGHLSILAASQHYNVPFSTLHGKVKVRKEIAAGLNPVVKKIGHPSILSLEMEQALVERLLCLEERGLGQTALQVRRAAFQLAEALGIIHNWNSEDKVAGVDRFRAFLKRNSGLSLRKPEGLSRARAEGLCKEEIDHYFSILKQVLNDYQLFDKPHCIYNMDESGLPLNNRPLKIVSQKGKREIISLTNVERGQNVTVVACCNAAGAYIPPMVIFKGVRNSIMYKDDLPPGSVVEMSDSGYRNEDLFISWRNHFTKFKPDDKILIIFDNHGSDTSVRALDFCKKTT
ncbi:hypothetical protein ANN_04232 [Periplaneta americana]|uniref:DDE-1 domain-containing protein n=1 Tax=Periplaneta americana TaxID=6978 RepID=A0ABQ8T8Q5_PERAM|nr:hypothetical protein ANN_04232 [Periplaneta americana]